MSRPVKKIMSPVEAYLDDRGSRKVCNVLQLTLCTFCSEFDVSTAHMTFKRAGTQVWGLGP